MLQRVPQSSARPFLIHAKVDLCAIKKAGRILGKKWNLVIIHRLMDHKMGFNDLKDAVGDVSAKILSQSLQELQANGIVERRVASESPVRVEYSLAPKGTDLKRALDELQTWGKRWDICRDERADGPNVTVRPTVGGVAPAEDAPAAAA